MISVSELGSFDAAFYCTIANKRLKLARDLIYHGQIRVCAGIGSHYQNQDRLLRPRSEALIA
jgi:hypothetical protein